jgi:hypothetical protein
MIAPSVMGAVIQNAAVPLDGYMTGFTINAVVMAASGLLGLLLLWPNTERKRLMAQATCSRNSREAIETLSRRPATQGPYADDDRESAKSADPAVLAYVAAA